MPIDFAGAITAAGFGAAAGGLASWAVKVWWENRVKHASDRALAEFQAALSGAAAAASFDYQRRLQDFNLFIAKKHEAIARLYELLLDAMSKIAHVANGTKKRALLEVLHVDDAADYLKDDAKVPRGKRAEIIDLWETDRARAISTLYEYQDWMESEYADRAWVKAHNYRLAQDLYLQLELSRDAEEFLRRLRHLLDRAVAENGDISADSMYETRVIHEDLDALRSKMRAEMARGEMPITNAPASATEVGSVLLAKTSRQGAEAPTGHQSR